MFKKFKDKLAEEMKQSPARLQASMQHIAQVVSPAPSSTSIQDLSSSKENFTLANDTDDTPKNSPLKHGFQTVDLTSPSANSINSRRSSISSTTSDTSSLFPIYESTETHYNFHSDMDQSASEIDENINSQLDRISKEQLYTAYRKVQTKYHKYRGRFTDLLSHYQDLEKTKSKLESLLVETQDKALRRISDLKEQCQLEQQAKAHLEEALRNDLEEKDHVINALKMKIKLLQQKYSSNQTLDNTDTSEYSLIDLASTDVDKNLSLQNPLDNTDFAKENKQLSDRVKKLETFSEKCRETLKRNKEQLEEMSNERSSLEKNYEILQESSKEKIQKLEDDLSKEKNLKLSLQNDLEALKKREEESAISLAENKLTIHRELDEKEEQIKRLQQELKQATEMYRQLQNQNHEKTEELKVLNLSIQQINEKYAKTTENFSQTFKQLRINIKELVFSTERDLLLKYQEVCAKNNNMLKKLQEYEKKFKLMQLKLEKVLIKEITENVQSQKEEMDGKIEEMKSSLQLEKDKNISLEAKVVELQTNIEKLLEENVINSELISKYKRDLQDLNTLLTERNKICEQSNTQIEEYKKNMEKLKNTLQTKFEEIECLKNSSINSEQLLLLEDEIENKRIEVLALSRETQSYTSTIKELKSRMKMQNNVNNTLLQELQLYKKSVQSIKKEHQSFRDEMNRIFESCKNTLVEKITNIMNENNKLRDEILRLNEHNDRVTENFTQLEKISNEKVFLEKQLKEQFNTIEEMKIRTNHIDELEMRILKYQENINSLKDQLQKEQMIVKNKDTAYEELNRQITFLSEQVVMAKQEHQNTVENLTHRHEEEVNKLQKIISEKESVQSVEDFQNLKSELETLAKSLLAKDVEIKNLNLNLQEKIENSTKLEKECEDLQKFCAEFEVKFLKLQEEHNNYIEQNTILNNRMELQKKNTIMVSREITSFKTLVQKDLLQFKDMVSNFIHAFKTELSNLKSFTTTIDKNNQALNKVNDDLVKLIQQKEEEEISLSNKVSYFENINRSLIDEKNNLIQKLKDQEVNKEQFVTENHNLNEQLSHLNEIKNKNEELSILLNKAQDCIEENSLTVRNNKDLEERNKVLENKIENLQNSLSSIKKDNLNKDEEIKQCQKEIHNAEENLVTKASELKALEIILKSEKVSLRASSDAKIQELKIAEDKLTELLGSGEQLKMKYENEIAIFQKEIDQLRMNISDMGRKAVEKDSEIDILNNKVNSLEEDLKIAVNTKNRLDELSKNINEANFEKNKLESQLDETLVTFQTKETQMQSINEDLRNQMVQLRQQLKNNEEEQNLRIKQIVKEFQAQLQDKDQELQSALEKRFDRQQNYETDVILEYKEQLKDFQIELTKKSQEIEQLTKKNESLERRLFELQVDRDEISQNLEEHWKDMQQQSINHEEKIVELTNEWKNERFHIPKTELLDEELESTAKLAMASVQSNANSIHALQETLLSQKREVAELRKLVKLKHESLEDSTEIEYLRNILFKYMMGKETLVLARVIAAIVKFDQEQTSKILKKEEDKLTLLGSLGLT